jgi:thiamine-phosphate pyrophosphorylase
VSKNLCMANKKQITGGVYLVVDSSYGEKKVLSVAREAMEGGLDVLQLWDSWKSQSAAVTLGKKLSELAYSFEVPFLVNNSVNVALEVNADGVHVDGEAPPPSEIRQVLGNNALVGVTCSTDLEKVLRWAKDGSTYVSFCSIYPSPSVNGCDIVPLSIVSEAKRRVKIPVFASGGITLENADKVLKAGADGIAVISEIMKSQCPKETTGRLKEIVSRAAYLNQKIPL